MLCPEVWEFQSPSCIISTKICNSEDEIAHTFKHQYFNHFVSVVLPDFNQVPKELVESCLDDSQFYRVDKICGAELVKESFVKYFVRKGSLTGISISHCPEEDRVALTPCGKLIFSLAENTYQTIGIESTFTNRSNNALGKNFLIVDLLGDTSKVEKICNILESRLSSLKHLCFDLVLAWEPHDQKVCPSSIAQYFHQKNYKVKACDIAYNQRFGYNVSVPKINEDDPDLSDLIDWLGAFALQCNNSSDDYISSMKYLEKKIVLGQVLYLSFVGLITHKRLQRLISNISRYTETKGSTWISTTTQGFQDSIITRRNQEIFLSNGDQHKTVIFRKNQSPVVYSFEDFKR